MFRLVHPLLSASRYMKIFLTIDVECYGGDYGREVYGRGMGHRAKGRAKTANTKDGTGLLYILSVLKDAGAKASFFVEALGATRWGFDSIKKVCADILEAGQEVQLHIHPSVALIDGFTDNTDVLHFQSMETQGMLIEKGLEILSKCGVQDIVAFRAGDFAADRNTLEAMRRCGLKISSNRDLDTKCSTRSKLNDYFPVLNDVSVRDAIGDVPLTCVRSPLPGLDGVYRHMEISAVSSGEMEWGIDRMKREGYAAICFLTHPGEFFCRRTGRVWKKNMTRLERLCGEWAGEMCFLSQVELTAVSGAAKNIPRLPLHLSLGRLIEQIAKRVREL